MLFVKSKVINREKVYNKIITWLSSMPQNEKNEIIETVRYLDESSKSLFTSHIYFEGMIDTIFRNLEISLTRLMVKNPRKDAEKCQLLTTLTHTIRPFDLASELPKDGETKAYNLFHVGQNEVFFEGKFYLKAPTERSEGLIPITNTLDENSPKYKCFYADPKKLHICKIQNYGTSFTEISQENNAGTFLTNLFTSRDTKTMLFGRTRDPKMLALLESLLQNADVKEKKTTEPSTSTEDRSKA